MQKKQVTCCKFIAALCYTHFPCELALRAVVSGSEYPGQSIEVEASGYNISQCADAAEGLLHTGWSMHTFMLTIR